MGWLFDSGYILEKYQERKNVEDLKNQAFYRFIYSIQLHGLPSFMFLVDLPTSFGSWYGVAAVCGYHTTFLVNSACHIWGNQAWNTSDLSKNNWWVALITFGEGWHNNHHAFEYSARHGLEWWQIDFCWYAIRFLEAVGLATDVKLPTEDHKRKKSFVSLKK
ncbi:putative fatty acid desaturase domain, acyl-CoA desaturase [Helianthus annuus]|nr:putative fatty acid desaturase domain, acyl-CoA desaturase [Helianthus annuus]KAJ0617455.1 putative fatty acid desaturase domain, acyl-CoA desaturase [Helianthus annuus]KAJ0775996.1 putative fatty acid desaturase domain, acyl-CoA desaturase [Helianthus annuus]